MQAALNAISAGAALPKRRRKVVIRMTTLFSSEMFMPHGHCYLWQPGLVWLQVVSNGSIAAAYISIFGTLVYLVRRIEDIPF